MTRKQPKPLTQILIKPAGPDCNMACAYCFYSHKKALFPGRETHRMSDEILRETIGRFMKSSSEEVSIVWQGGEPTLMGLEFFRKAVSWQQEYGGTHVVGNALQTNGLLLDESWARFLRTYRFLVGLSLDGPRHVHDRYRVAGGGGGTWVVTVDRARMLLDQGVTTNALVVVNDYSVRYPEEIYEFHKELGLTFMQFVPCLEVPQPGQARPRFTVSSKQYGIFLCRLFDRWRKDVRAARAQTSVRFFDSLFHCYLGLPPPECTIRRECGDYLVVEHNGDVYSCDFFVEPRWKLGNVLQGDLRDMLNSERQTRFGERKARLAARCLDCRWLELCRGGCTAYREPRDRGAHRLCDGLKIFYEHADAHFRKIAADWKKRQVPQTAPVGPGIKIGRNEPCPCGSGKKYKKCCGA